ncbi:RcnB family protein [Sphingomonas alba]|uniref:RcnB family protein n=1 Tax=Sphingomonas alba TaxID=2908208 RepID=A0ABT0RQF7_9SPHN|nr:RcnB family protein [Sphingomonas alba]MCL6684785.1 RcnB family protein [Sphingomonas alba]
MRKLPLFLLLASAAVPALAQPGDDNGNGRHHRDSNQSEQSESRPQRTREVQQPSNGGEQRVRTERVERGQVNQAAQSGQSGQSGFAEQRERFRAQREQQVQATQVQSGRNERTREARQGNSNGSQSNWQGRQNNWQGSNQANWQDRQRRVRTVPDTNVTRGPSRTEQQAFQNRRRTDYRNGNYTRWTNNWRHDRRYDWNSYRNYHRSIFSIGFYSDPFGWNYRPWSIGSYMYPSYYDQSFWLNDPWQYRLPPAYGPYRWVRYWDDALMVNIYTGQVVDVIHNFFW